MKTIITIITLSAAAAITAAAGISGYAFNPDNEHYYKAVHVPGGISWSQAKAEAEKAGGYLATITSENENKFILRLVNRKELWLSTSSFDNFGPWIGGYQEKGAREPDRGWKWVTGEEFLYSNWAPLEPSGEWMGKDENRLQLYCKSDQKRNSKWNDALDSPLELTVCSYVIEKGDIQTDPRETMITEPILEVHEFSGTNGQSCHGQVVAYNENNDTVTIEKKDKRKCYVDLAHLSSDDQTYVREWHLVKEFCTPNRISISAVEKNCDDDCEMAYHDSEGNHVAMQTLESIGYEITIKNRVGASLSGLEMEYCIYYEQDRLISKHRMSVGQGVKCGTLDIGTLAAEARMQIDTEPVILFKRQKEHGPIELLRGEIHGIWIRLYLPLADGRRAMIEYATPNRIIEDRQWATTDVSVLTERFLHDTLREMR